MIANDKIMHLFAGALIALPVTAFYGEIAGFCAAMVAGWVKEWIWDAWLGRGEFDPWDAVATTGGGLAVAVLYSVARM